MGKTTYRDVPVMMHAIDNEGVLIDVNDEWCRVMGYRRDEVLGRKSLDFLTEESRNLAIKSVLPFFFEKGYCKNVPYQFVTKSGAIIEVELSADSVRNEDGTVRESRAVLVNRSEREADDYS
ncbi:PAS domain-containing protein [Sulfidibacter corallicola]|uniref:PAS domain-containing protein n=1 Tax=Sulfidibacter corallicola TaxID=2818388 RepID=A0A8A4TJE3_SULCO|nr:PAS domain-containing protein [Sulfidibacter corallicola]QTD49272.1 PAS domain-containing protein [Sulfidibacter corallicola]